MKNTAINLTVKQADWSKKKSCVDCKHFKLSPGWKEAYCELGMLEDCVGKVKKFRLITGIDLKRSLIDSRRWLLGLTRPCAKYDCMLED